MAKKRGPDGVPISIPSIPIRKDVQQGRRGDIASTENSPMERSERPKRGSLFPEEPSTRPVTRSTQGGASGHTREGGEPKTVIAGGARARRKDALGVEQSVAGGETRTADPVVGWLVVVNGPGLGCSVRLGNGQNSIGRGETSRVRLNFGDRKISRNDHAVLTYDPRGNRFYIQQGKGVNLVYLDESPVLAPTPLPPGSRIVLGDTTLRFVAFCDDEFRWSDQEEPGE